MDMKGIWIHDYHELPFMAEIDDTVTRVYINNTDGLVPKEYIKQLKERDIEVYQWIVDSLRRPPEIEPLLKGIDGVILDGIRWKSWFSKDVDVHKRLKEVINRIGKPTEVSTKIDPSYLLPPVFKSIQKLVWGLDYDNLPVDAICPMIYSKELPLAMLTARRIIDILEKNGNVYPILYSNNAEKEAEQLKLRNYSIYGVNI